MDWREVAVTVSSDGEEAVADLFYGLGCSGVAVEDPELLRSYIESGIWDYHAFGGVELTGTSVVKGYFSEDEELAEKLETLDQEIYELRQRFPNWVVQGNGISVREVDWETAWKAFLNQCVLVNIFSLNPRGSRLKSSRETSCWSLILAWPSVRGLTPQLRCV